MVYITIRPARGPGRDFVCTTERFGNNWIYRLELPPQVERHQLVRVLVQVLLQEMANRRRATTWRKSPLWLTEGLTQQMLNSRAVEIILPPPNQSYGALMLGPTVIQARQPDPLELARRVLRDRPPLSLAELSWPGTDQMDSAAGETFRCSAHLFVTELLRLDQGREHLRAMINELAGCYNWQTAFLRAFAPHFANQLAVEKWWTLQVVHFVGRDPTQLWTAAESWRQLADLLRASVAVRRTQSDMPAHADVTLQTVIREWEPCARRRRSAARLTSWKWPRCGWARSSWRWWTITAACSPAILSVGSERPQPWPSSGCSPRAPRKSCARRPSNLMSLTPGVLPCGPSPAAPRAGRRLPWPPLADDGRPDFERGADCNGST